MNVSTSQSTKLVEIMEGAELFHTPDKEPFATIQMPTHKETWHLKAQGFKRWLMKQFYENNSTSARAQAVQEAIGVLEGKAIYDGPEIKVYTRIAEQAGKVYVDLVNDRWEVIEIDATGWRIVSRP